MKPIKATHEGKEVTIIDVIPFNQPSLWGGHVAFINSIGALDLGYMVDVEEKKLAFTSCHYEDEIIPVDKIGMAR